MNANLTNFLYPLRFTEMAAVATSLQRFGFRAQASLLGTFIQDRHGNDHTNGRSTQTYNVLSPALFVSWKPGASSPWNVNGFVKKSFRMPTFNDLYYTETGNKDLDPEYTYQYDIGADFRRTFAATIFKSISLKGDAYYNKVTNKIIAYPAGQQFRWTMLNLGIVKIYGIEASADLAARFMGADFGVRLNYTFQKACDYTDPTDSYYGDQIPYIPRHSGSVSAYASWKGWDFNYSFIYTGQRYNAQENIPENYEQPWYTHDASLFKNFCLGKVDCRAGVELNNIFGQDYEVVLNYPMPGRNFKAIIKINI